MATASHVAEYLIWLAANECVDDPDFLTPLKLQKLLYYTQGWACAEWGQPLFRDRIEAWRDGPVVPSVYALYKGHEKSPIVSKPGPQPTGLTDAERALVRSVWDSYKQFSGWTLRDMTHAEEPYVEAYRPQDDADRCTRPIPPDRMKDYFARRSRDSLGRIRAGRDRLRAFAAENTRNMTGRDTL